MRISSCLAECEFALWLEAIANGGSYQQLTAALTAAAGELNELRPTTIQQVEKFFQSDRAAAALGELGKSDWQQQWVMPDEQGLVQEAGGWVGVRGEHIVCGGGCTVWGCLQLGYV